MTSIEEAGSSNNIMQKITPFLWFDNNAEEAMQFYVSIFNDSKSRAFAAAAKKALGRKEPY